MSIWRLAVRLGDVPEAGVLVDGAGLRPSAQGGRVKYCGKERSLVDGPFED